MNFVEITRLNIFLANLIEIQLMNNIKHVIININPTHWYDMVRFVQRQIN